MNLRTTFFSILFVTLVTFSGFFAILIPAQACSGCTYGGFTPGTYYPNQYYYDDYYGGGWDYYWDDYYYWDYPTYDYYYWDWYYYTPPTPTFNPTTPPPIPTCTLSASQINITAGTPVMISWTASNAVNASITNIGAVSASFGSRSVSPQVTTTYVGTFSGQGGTTSCQTTVFVQPQPTPSCSISASPTQINQGDTTSLIWNSQNADSVQISNIGSVSTTGARNVSPAVTTTYVATVSGQGGTNSCQTTVTVNQQVPQNQIPSCSLSIVQQGGQSGDSAILSWTTNNATTMIINNVGTVNTGSGSRTVFPGAGNTIYTATVTGPGGSSTCQTSTFRDFTNINQQAPFCTLSVNQNSVALGSGVTLQWNTNANANSMFINNSVGFVNTGFGSRTVFPNSAVTYTGTVTNSNGQSAVCQTTVNVFATNNPTLFQQPGDQPLASVALSQIPFTGFEAGPVVTFIFWFTVALWSMGVAYIVAGKQGIQMIAERVFPFGSAGSVQDAYDTRISAPSTREDEYVNGFVYEDEYRTPQIAMSTATSISAPTPVYTDEQTVESVIESRAHASGVLMSPESVLVAKNLGETREETLRIFGEVLSDAVRTIAREDGWILLSSDRFNELVAKYTSNTTAKNQAPDLSPEHLAV